MHHASSKEPNHSVEPTASGLRPPAAAHLKRSAQAIRESHFAVLSDRSNRCVPQLSQKAR